jgi:hypothetical protein
MLHYAGNGYERDGVVQQEDMQEEDVDPIEEGVKCSK